MFAGHCDVGELAADTGPFSYPANMGYSHNAVSMLAHRFRRRPNMKEHWVNDLCLLGLAINLLAAGGETCPVFVYENGESSSLLS